MPPESSTHSDPIVMFAGQLKSMLQCDIDTLLLFSPSDAGGRSSCRVGKYSVLVQSFEQAALPALSQSVSNIFVCLVCHARCRFHIKEDKAQ